MSGFDLAWQIRTVRCLWCDVDNTTVEAALALCEAKGIPRPTVIVSSGNGVHLYWSLVEPYLIDDAEWAKPPQVQSEWVVLETNGKKKAINFFLHPRTREKVYLENPKTGNAIFAHRPDLSAKAIRAQDVIAGIASQIGGDHTQDLSRLLRMPGTMNRKNGRNKRPPTACLVIEHDPNRRYPFSDFERLVELSPQLAKRKKVAQIKLLPAKKLSGKDRRLNPLFRLINVCAMADDRSEADFSLCCHAIEHAIDKAWLWQQIHDVGKFAERGDDYFERTWAKAEFKTRENIYNDFEARELKAAAAEPANFDPSDAKDASEAADFEGLPDDAAVASTTGGMEGDQDEAQAPPSRKKDAIETIEYCPARDPVAKLMGKLTEVLAGKGCVYSRANAPVRVISDDLKFIMKNAELGGVLNSLVELKLLEETKDGMTEKFEPLPKKYGEIWMNHPKEMAALPSITVFSRNPLYTQGFVLVQPGYNRDTGIYYAGPKISPKDGTETLDRLLSEFCFKTPGDRTNYLAFLLTMLMVPKFVGDKPAAIFNGNQPSIGKTYLAQCIAILRDGKESRTCSYVPDDVEFEKRLAAEVKSGATTIIIDNAKGKRTNGELASGAVIDSPVLERSITDRILSYRLLGTNETIHAENSHFFLITANGIECSRDIVTRSVIINLYYEGDPRKRSFSIPDLKAFARQHREDLLAELLGMVERWKLAGMPLSDVSSRFVAQGWAPIIGGILQVCGEEDFLANQGEAEAAMDPFLREFRDLVEEVVKDRPGERPKTPADWAVAAGTHKALGFNDDTKSIKSKATKMGMLISRFVDESFEFVEPDFVVTYALRAEDSRKGKVYLIKEVERAPRFHTSSLGDF